MARLGSPRNPYRIEVTEIYFRAPDQAPEATPDSEMPEPLLCVLAALAITLGLLGLWALAIWVMA